ncbi:NAD(P)/FAD-dependent oxidoreductase [Streptomyces sp. NPDC058676]|uniref:NAD(P)/FAD-dependent oxidoreductase n=1 Tax=unclassified Streptomyces TaxID=2593676 RepID=UPI003664D280
MRRTLLVAGHGMVGHRLVAQVRRRDPQGRWRVVAVTAEAHSAYDRMALSSYALRPPGDPGLDLVGPLRTDPLVELRTGTRLVGIDVAGRTAHCADGTALPYDALVLATGSRPFVPPVPGSGLPGCFVYRTLDDLTALRAAAEAGAPGVVIGGGLLGLEAAEVLRRLGMRPHVIEMAPRLMPVQVDAAGAEILAGLVRSLGVDVVVDAGVEAVRAGPDGRVAGVALRDGRVLPARVVVFAAGVRPRDELAAAAGLSVAPRGGVAVDALCRTGAPGIWAVGECASLDGRTYGLVAPGYRMADTVAARLTGDETAVLPPLDTSTRLKVLGVGVGTFGDAHATTPGALSLARTVGTSSYEKLVLSADGRTLLGGVLVGDLSRWAVLHALAGRELPTEPELLPAAL